MQLVSISIQAMSCQFCTYKKDQLPTSECQFHILEKKQNKTLLQGGLSSFICFKILYSINDFDALPWLPSYVAFSIQLCKLLFFVTQIVCADSSICAGQPSILRQIRGPGFAALPE